MNNMDARVLDHVDNHEARHLFYIPDEVLDALEPCPFCGGEPYCFWNDADKEADPDWVVTCGICAADGPPGATLTEAFNAWNKRP